MNGSDRSFVSVHVFAKSGVDAALVACSSLLKEFEHVSIKAERDLLFVFRGDERARARPCHFLLRRNIAVIDLLVRHFLECRFLPRRKPDGLIWVKAVLNDSSMFVSHDYSLFWRK